MSSAERGAWGPLLQRKIQRRAVQRQRQTGPVPGPAPTGGTPIDPKIYTVTNTDARLRKADKLEQSDDPAGLIPEGARVEITEEKKSGGQLFVHVREYGSRTTFGWTAKSNLQDLSNLKDTTYKEARTRTVFHAGGHDLLVYLPPGGIQKGNDVVDVFMFFHGDLENYRTRETSASSESYDDNPAIAADIPGALAAAAATRNMIAICPQSNAGKPGLEWQRTAAASYSHMVNQVIQNLAAELGRPKLAAGAISMAGHSSGGYAFGPSVDIDKGGLDATDVTLQDGGFYSGLEQLVKWFLVGKPVKRLRVISKGHDAEERNVLQHFTKEKLEAFVKANAKRLKGASIDVKPFTPSGQLLEGDMIIDGGIDVQLDGKDQGHLRSYLMRPPDQSEHKKDPTHNTQHWEVRNQSMAAAMAAGGADQLGKTARPGSYLVVADAAIRDDKMLSQIVKKTRPTTDTVVKVSQFRVEDGWVFALMDGFGWTRFENLRALGATALDKTKKRNP